MYQVLNASVWLTLAANLVASTKDSSIYYLLLKAEQLGNKRRDFFNTLSGGFVARFFVGAHQRP
jgi:hypothetical protein